MLVTFGEVLSGKTLSLRSFPIGNCQDVEDPCKLHSKKFIGQDSVF